MSIVYTPEELTAFAYFMGLCDPQVTGQINGKDFANFLRSSGLSTQLLKDIWAKTSGNGETLTKDEFYASLKIVALAQAGHNIDTNLLYKNIATPLPQFQGISPPSYEISNDQYQKYENYFHTVAEGNQIIQGQQARQLFSKTQLPREQLLELWRLCDMDEKGYLTKPEFILAVHLIGLCKKGFPLPTILPDSLLMIARGQQQSVIQQPPQRFGSNSNIQPQLGRIGSNSNIQVPKRFGSNSNISIQPLQIPQRLSSDQMYQHQGQQLVTNVSLIPGYDNIQNGINQQRQSVNDQSQQLFGLQTSIKDLYNNILAEKQDELQQMSILNDNLRTMINLLQEQYRVMSDELIRMQTIKSQLKVTNNQLSHNLNDQIQKNNDMMSKLIGEQQLQAHQQSSYLPQQQQQPAYNYQQSSNFSGISPQISNQQQPQQQYQQLQPPTASVSNMNSSPFTQSPQTNIIKIQPQQSQQITSFINDQDYLQDTNKPLQSSLKPQVIIPIDVQPKKQVQFQEQPQMDDNQWNNHNNSALPWA